MTRSAATSPKAPVCLAAALLVTALMAGGCASAPVGGLAAQRAGVVRELTTQCYWTHEGERVVYGGLAVHSACKQWALSRSRVAMPGSAGLTLH